MLASILAKVRKTATVSVLKMKRVMSIRNNAVYYRNAVGGGFKLQGPLDVFWGTVKMCGF